MDTSTDASFARPTRLDTTAFPPWQRSSPECSGSQAGSSKQSDTKAFSDAAFNTAPESVTSGLNLCRSSCKQKGISFLRNMFSSQEGSTTSSSAAEGFAATNTLPPRAVAEGERQRLSAPTLTYRRNSGAACDEKNVVRVMVRGENQERSGVTVASAKTTCADFKQEESRRMSLTNNAFSAWQFQGLVSGAAEESDRRSAKRNSSSLSAMLLSGEGSSVIPTAISLCSEHRCDRATPLADAIRLSLQYAVPPFMSISSFPTPSEQSISVMRTSVQHLIHNSQHCIRPSSSHLGVGEKRLSDDANAAEQRSSGAFPAHNGALATQGMCELSKRWESSFVPPQRGMKGWTGKLPPICPPLTVPDHNSATLPQPSPHNPWAPTVPCSPVLGYDPNVVNACILEEQEEREALLKKENLTFKTFLAEEVSSYLAVSRLSREKDRQHKENSLVIAQDKLVEEETSLLRDAMHARMIATEVEHIRSVSVYSSIEPVGIPKHYERGPQSMLVDLPKTQADVDTKTQGILSDPSYSLSSNMRIDRGAASKGPPPLMSTHAFPMESSKTKDVGDRPLKDEIQRQLRLGRQFSRKRDEWTTDPIFLQLY